MGYSIKYIIQMILDNEDILKKFKPLFREHLEAALEMESFSRDEDELLYTISNSLNDLKQQKEQELHNLNKMLDVVNTTREDIE